MQTSKRQKWTPNKNHHTIETYVEATERELKKQGDIKDNKGYNNLSKNERIAMKELSDHTVIIITKADIAGAVVIIYIKDYISEAHHQLNNKHHYKILNKDPTKTNAKLVNNTIQKLKKEKLLKEKTADGLKVSNPKTPKFYMQPKIHKKDNPGRPVVSSVNCHASSISKYVDYHLQLIVRDIPSYVRDTKDFLTKLNDIRHIPKESLLVTLDVKSLYSNIPNNESIKAVREAYDKHPSKSVSTKVIITFLSLILTLNNFIFNCSHYLQVMGCTVGTICALSYANNFIGQFEAKHIYPYILGNALLFLRYIDDYFRDLEWNYRRTNIIHR